VQHTEKGVEGPGGQLRTLTRADLQRFIESNRIEAAILPMSDRTPTVEDAARALGVDTEAVVKSLLFRVDEEPFLVVNNGLARVDRRKLARFFGVGRKRIHFASPEEAHRVTGYVVGSMPPFGHLRKLRTLVDPAVARLEVVYGGGGSIDAMMRVATPVLLAVTEAERVPLSG
jgi:prolyl-tRNA editing enzyme YbaK/EbsC (Cys-tRNA(Pro) deacylase)